MSFIYEVVPERDYDFFRAMDLKSCWGNGHFTLSKYTQWCADRERNAYIVGIGGGYDSMPHFHDLWWNGYKIRMETVCGGNGNYETGVNIIWFIKKLPIPAELWDAKDEIVKMIYEAFGINMGWCKPEYLKSISVKFECEPQIAADDDAIII